MMFWFFLIIIFLIGTLQPVQTSANSRAKEYLGSPIVASLCNFMVGALLTLALALIVEHGLGIPSQAASELPWWAWLECSASCRRKAGLWEAKDCWDGSSLASAAAPCWQCSRPSIPSLQ